MAYFYKDNPALEAQVDRYFARLAEFNDAHCDGKLSVLLRSSQQPVTAAQMNVKTEETGLPIILVSDGRVLSESLHTLGRDEKWLYRKLATHGLTSPKQAFLLTADQSGSTYCVPKEAKK